MTARIVWPVAAVLVSLLLLAVGGIILASQRANEIAYDRQRAMLGAVIEDEKAKALRDLAVTVSSSDAIAALQHPMSAERAQRFIGSVLETTYGFDQSFVLTPENVVVTGRVGGENGDQRKFAWAKPYLIGAIQVVRDRLARMALRRDPTLAQDETDAAVLRTGEARAIFDSSILRVVAAVATPARDGDSAFGGLVAAASVPLGPAALERIGRASGHANLRLEMSPAAASTACPFRTNRGS